jgi:hypothetical protein
MRMLRHHDKEEKADSEGKQTTASAVNGGSSDRGGEEAMDDLGTESSRPGL